MAEKVQPFSDNISENELIDILIERGMLDPLAVEQLIAEQKQGFEQSRQALAGVAYVVDPCARLFKCLDALTGESLQEIPWDTFLSQSEPLPQGATEEWETWGDHWCVIDANEGISTQSIRLEHSLLQGLVVTSGQVYRYTSQPLEAKYLAISHTHLCEQVSRKPENAALMDMYLSEDGSFLCLTNRKAGSLTLISTRSQHPLGTVNIRPPGSTQAINLAIDTTHRKIYMTDNKSFILYVLDVDTLYLQKMNIGLNALGNIALSPDASHLYLISLKPNVGLKYLDLNTNEIVRALKLKGELFSQNSIDPCDLMVMTPDRRHLLIMTYLNEPQPFTPIISVIDTEQVKTVRRYAVKDGKKPALLAVPYENMAVRYQKSPLELLLEVGIVTPQSLEQLKYELAQERQKAHEEAAGIMEVKQEVIDVGGASPTGPPKVPSLEPEIAETVSLPGSDAIPVIVSILSERFYQDTEIDLSKHDAEMARLRMEAEKIRLFLETHNAVEVLIEDILDEYKLDFLLNRQEVINLIEMKSLKEAIQKQAVVTPPTHCPHCNQKLLGTWDCDICGLELENPERSLKRSLSSADSRANLPSFHLGLPDPKRQRILLLDDKKTLTWELSNPNIHPWDATWLPNRNILLADKAGHRVLECSPTGKIKWEATPDLPLQQPVRATYFIEDGEILFLIADQGNHRVLVMDREQHIHWKYGIAGVDGKEEGHLSHPSDIQFTFDRTYLIADTGNDRVLEIERKDIVRIFGKKVGLSAPNFAQRLFDGHTLVIDAGNSRVVELDSEGNICLECFYFTEDISPEMRIERPLRAIRRENKNVILMDEDKAIELLPAKKKLVWFSPLEHLSRRAELKADDTSPKRKRYVKSFYEYRLPTLEEIAELLGGGEKKETPKSLPLQAIKHLKALIEKRREKEQKTSRQAQVQSASDAKLLDTPIFCIDRIYHLVLRIDREGRVKWHYGTDPKHRLLRPHHLTYGTQTIWVADTGHHRIIEINLKDKSIVNTWEGLFSQPRSAVSTSAGILVADQRNRRLVEVDVQGNILWEFKNFKEISGPFYAEVLPTGTILFVDWGLHMVKEITKTGDICWSYGQSRRAGNGENQLAYPEFATRLPNGMTLVADTRNQRVLEISQTGKIIWEYGGSSEFFLKNPLYCQRLSNDHTLIAYDNYRQLLEIDKDGNYQWHFAMGNEPMVRLADGDISITETRSDAWNTVYHQSEQQQIQSAQAAGKNRFEISVGLMKNCQMKALRASLILMALENLGEVLKTFPSRDQLMADQFGEKMIIALFTEQTAQMIQETVAGIAEVVAVKIVPLVVP